MKLKCKISLLVDKNGARIELHDEPSGLTFFVAQMSAENFMGALGRLGYSEVDKAEVFNLGKIGKKLLISKLEFEMPEGVLHKEQCEVAYRLALEKCPEGWEPDNYFNSQDSFFYKNEKRCARATIRRYVEEPKLL
jgi:hypothetical protein